MINEYFYEFIALIVLLTFILIYFFTRKSKKKDLNNLKNNIPIKSEIIEDPYEEKISTEEEEKEVSPTQVKIKSPRQKGKVPSHGKITKENFKDFKGVKLLIAEDNLINQKVLNALLKDSGIEITMADDGQIALDILEKNSDFDMILMDAHMPRVDGFEATRIIRANPKYEHIVVVALSGDTAVDDVRKMTESGMQEHLEKPLRINDFYDILYAYTQSNSTQNTRGLNIDNGLTVCGGDEAFYKEILSEFTGTYTNVSQKLLELLHQKEIEHANALLFDFIGVTANIGAYNIGAIAQELKEAIKGLEENSYNSILDDFEVELKVLLKEIEAYKQATI